MVVRTVMLRNIAFAAAATLIAMTASVKAMDAADLAGSAGFIIGAARHCGVSATRASHVRQWIAAKLVAAAEPQRGVFRLDGFVDTASAASNDDAISLRCEAVTEAFAAIESHIDHDTVVVRNDLRAGGHRN
jgi:hypothetical protein